MPPWFELTIDVPAELSDVMASHLFDLGSPGLECIERDGMTSLVAYFREDPPIGSLLSLCSRLSLEEDRVWAPAIRSRAIDEEDWAEGWKQHFRPTLVGKRLQICAPWDEQTVSGRINVIIHPGMAFGTGQHPTTRGCLELIEDTNAASKVIRALDVGTGSGILAIALAKLGASQVCAIDNDPQACSIAVENSERNGTAAIVSVSNDWPETNPQFDIIVANLFSDLLRDLAGKLQSLLAPSGRLVCSGFLASDEASVIAAYPRLEVARRKEEEGWVTLLLTGGEFHS